MKKGFTLFEVSVTLAIVGVFLLLGIPNFIRWTNHYKVNGVADEIANGLRYAQQQTITEQKPYYVQFYLANDIPPLNNSKNSMKIYRLESGNEIVLKKIVFHEAYLAQTDLANQRLQYRVNGSCDSMGRLKITEKADGTGTLRVVRIVSATGKIGTSETW